MLERSDPSGGGTIGGSSGVVMRKSVSSPLTLVSLFVWNHTPRPPLRPPFSPPMPIRGPR